MGLKLVNDATRAAAAVQVERAVKMAGTLRDGPSRD